MEILLGITSVSYQKSKDRLHLFEKIKEERMKERKSLQ